MADRNSVSDRMTDPDKEVLTDREEARDEEVKGEASAVVKGSRTGGANLCAFLVTARFKERIFTDRNCFAV